MKKDLFGNAWARLAVGLVVFVLFFAASANPRSKIVQLEEAVSENLPVEELVVSEVAPEVVAPVVAEPELQADKTSTDDGASTNTGTDTADLTVPVTTDTAAVDEAAPTETASAEAAQAPELSTDKEDYHPGETATIFGNFFASLENVVLKVFGNDENDNPDNYAYNEQTVTANESGSFTATYNLDSTYRPFYEMEASDESGNVLASGWFRDSAVGTFDQCGNDDGDGYDTGDTGCRWVNGNLVPSKATYHEDDATPQRVWLKGLAPNSAHTITLKYATTKGGKHAYDFLTSYDYSEGWIAEEDICQDIALCEEDNTPDLEPIPTDPMAGGNEDGIRNFEMRGADITDVSDPVFSGSYAADSDTVIVVSFTVDPNGGDMCTTKNDVESCGVALFFGAHISDSDEWSPEPTAITIPGSPYHVALAEVDGDPDLIFPQGGGRDNQMQANVILVTPQGTLSGVKYNDADGDGVHPIEGADTPIDGWTIFLDGNGNGSLNGGETSTTTAGGGIYSFANLVDGTYSVCEVLQAGWTQTYPGGPSCHSVTITNGVNTPSGSLDFGNTNPAHLTLLKTAVNNNGGSAVDTDWTLSANGPTNISGTEGQAAVTNATVSAGSYDLSESGGPSGYSASAWVCTGTGVVQNDSDTVTLDGGESATCTITNDDQQAYITVVKVVTKDNGGTADPDDFNLTLEGNSVSSGVAVPVNPGTYTAAETLLTGYSFTGFSGDCDSNGDTTVALGQSKTCTLTNDDIAPVLHLRKVVTNDNGGTALDTDWTLTANGDGANDFSGSTPVDSGAGLLADTFALSESGPTGYSASSWVCTGDGDQDDSNITLGLGEEATCTITNDDIAPILHLRKVVTNNSGGSATVADFPLSADGTGSNDLSGTSPVDSGPTLQADTWALSETTLAGYTPSAWVCDGGDQNVSSITLDIGEEATCTITNDDQQAYITVVKSVVNDNDGLAQPNDFNLTLEGSSVSSGVAVPVNPGTYTAGETNLAGYIFEGFTGDCDSNGDTTVALGQNKTCTLTNNDTPGHFTGGGSFFPTSLAGQTNSSKKLDNRVTHGFTLHCDVNRGPNRLEINWAADTGGKGRASENNFHLTSLTTANCINDPTIDPQQPKADFDTIIGTGTGTFNNVAGATISFTFSDAGEPGRNDGARMTITTPSKTYTFINATDPALKGYYYLDQGNQQAHQDD